MRLVQLPSSEIYLKLDEPQSECVVSASFRVSGVFLIQSEWCIIYFGQVPSWLNEKRAEVSVNKTMWSATITSTLLYLTVGILGMYLCVCIYIRIYVYTYVHIGMYM